ncbi:MAG: hypothetical protein ACLR71_17300 [[Clostridium] scindens]
MAKGTCGQGRDPSWNHGKKFRELHSFAAYICENKERYQVDEGYQDDYYPYLKMVAKQENL